MKIAIMQPYFFPYIGYFQLINAVDTFAFLDNVNFINKGWVNRNRILLNGRDHMFTLPLRHASQNKKINEIEISVINGKILQTITHAYSKAPQFDKIIPFISQVFEEMKENKRLGTIAETSVRLVAEYLDLDRIFFTCSNDFAFSNNLKGEKRIISICKEAGANTYINPSSNKGFYNYNNFQENGIKLHYIDNKIRPYKQFRNEFISHLSIIDVLMFNPKENVKKLLEDYELN